MSLGDTLIPVFKRAWGSSLQALIEASEAPSRAEASEAPNAVEASEAPNAVEASDAPSTLSELRAAAGQPSDGSARDEAELITDELVRWLWSRNQFELLDEEAREELLVSVEGALSSMEQNDALAPALREHRSELSAFVRARYGAAPREVVCSEYAPDLQLAVLGLSVASLAQPVLDVGCGEHATLVHALTSEGIEARGLDRVVHSELATQSDWLSFVYGRARYGTVLSHLGFSLHFLHHHMAAGDMAYQYARAYMAILGSLVVGGRFVYTPGLPFIETLLDASMYRVHHVAFADELRVASLREIERSTGLALSHATHVTRLA
ncbi:MAG: hypothetical protein RLZZ450_5309 [Pseudomonadota bacterium]|jgi:hypothetical protein